MKFLQQKEHPQLKVISMFIPCSSFQIIDLYSKHPHLTFQVALHLPTTHQKWSFQPFQLHTPFTTPKFAEKNRCPQRRSVVVTSLKQNGDVPTTPPEQRETNPENDILLYWLVHRDPYIREILDTLGMVPLIINPIYTLYSVYLLGIFHVGHQMNWILLMDKILHHQGWWLSHYW